MWKTKNNIMLNGDHDFDDENNNVEEKTRGMWWNNDLEGNEISLTIKIKMLNKVKM